MGMGYSIRGANVRDAGPDTISIDFHWQQSRNKRFHDFPVKRAHSITLMLSSTLIALPSSAVQVNLNAPLSSTLAENCELVRYRVTAATGVSVRRGGSSYPRNAISAEDLVQINR
jgi:hypothetical protein